MTHEPPSARTTLKRGANRAVYDPVEIRKVLEAGTVAHVGVGTDDGPIVLPMMYGLRGDQLLIHGSVANAMMRASKSIDICATVTILDGLVVARTPLHNSVNYRSVVVRGTATVVDDPDDKVECLHIINDHIAPIWDTARPPSDSDYRQTLVLSMPLTEASAKIRTGDPIDDDDDLDGPHWAGVVPLHTTWGEPAPAADLRGAIAMPDAVRDLGGSEAHPT